MKYAYIYQEAKSNFKDWTVHGLVFLLKDSTLSQNIQVQIRRKIDLIHAVEP